MRNGAKILLLIGVLIFIIVITSSKESNVLSAAEFYERINEPDVQLVDIRTPEEYKMGHLVNAINIDRNSEAFEESFLEFNPEKPIYIYCKDGSKSMDVVTILEHKDFKFVYYLRGGIVSWKEAGYKIITEEVNTSDENRQLKNHYSAESIFYY